MSDKSSFPQANNTLLWKQRYTHEQTRYKDIYINHYMNFILSVGRSKKWLLLHLFLCLFFLLFFYPYSQSLIYINLFYLPIFNFAYLFFLCFLSFLFSQYICQFYFHCFIPQLAPQFCFPVCALVFFLTGKHNFLFLLFTGSIYCILFLLDCFDIADGYVCVYIYIFHCFNYYLPDFVTAICVGFVIFVYFF